MKKQATLYSFMLAAAVAFFVAACNKNTGNGSAPIAAPYPTGLAPLLLSNGTKIGFYTQTTNFGSYYLANGSSYSIQPDYLTVLRDAMGVCDRDAAMGGTNGGISSCQGSWMGGYHDMVIMVDSSSQTTTSNGSVIASSGKLVMRSYPSVNYNNWYNLQLPSFSNFFYGLFGFGTYNMAGLFNPMTLQITIWPINNDGGFEIRAYGPTGSRAYNKLFQLQVAVGSILQSSAYQFQMYLNSQPISNGTMVRCTTPTCGLSYIP